MRIPADAFIAREKLGDYLLKPRPWDDKSGYLAQGGFTTQHATALETAIRNLAASVDAVEDGAGPYGIFWRVSGDLAGINGKQLPVELIWMQRHRDGRIHLVTLRPRRRDERRTP